MPRQRFIKVTPVIGVHVPQVFLKPRSIPQVTFYNYDDYEIRTPKYLLHTHRFLPSLCFVPKLLEQCRYLISVSYLEDVDHFHCFTQPRTVHYFG